MLCRLYCSRFGGGHRTPSTVPFATQFRAPRGFLPHNHKLQSRVQTVAVYWPPLLDFIAEYFLTCVEISTGTGVHNSCNLERTICFRYVFFRVHCTHFAHGCIIP
jgi:hypothetical protein